MRRHEESTGGEAHVAGGEVEEEQVADGTSTCHPPATSNIKRPDCILIGLVVHNVLY